jgi:hypothetical protein
VHADGDHAGHFCQDILNLTESFIPSDDSVRAKIFFRGLVVPDALSPPEDNPIETDPVAADVAVIPNSSPPSPPMPSPSPPLIPPFSAN